MAKQERTRKSSPQNRVKSFSEANEVIEPWFELNEEERRIFDGYISSREKDTWLEADIECLTKLAKIAVEMDLVWKLYKENGPISFSQRGMPVASPYLATHGQLSSNYKALRTALGLSASQRGVSGNKQVKRNQQDSAASKVMSNESKITSLIAKP